MHTLLSRKRSVGFEGGLTTLDPVFDSRHFVPKPSIHPALFHEEESDPHSPFFHEHAERIYVPSVGLSNDLVNPWLPDLFGIAQVRHSDLEMSLTDVAGDNMPGK